MVALGSLRVVLALGVILVAAGHELHPASPLGKAVEAVRAAVEPAKAGQADAKAPQEPQAGGETLAEHYKVLIERRVHALTPGEKHYMEVVSHVPHKFCGNTKDGDSSERALVCHVLKGLPKAFFKAAQRQQPGHYDDLLHGIQGHICKGGRVKDHFKEVCGVLTHLRAGVPPMRRNKAQGQTYEQAVQEQQPALPKKLPTPAPEEKEAEKEAAVEKEAEKEAAQEKEAEKKEAENNKKKQTAGQEVQPLKDEDKKQPK